MSHNQHRAALFLDFENLVQTLKNLSRQGRGDFGEAPKIDFEYLVARIHQQYGSLDPDDFIVAGNFSHYNQQLGGLNRVATIIDTDSFLPRLVRKEDQKTPGKRYVIHNYADMVLAFEVGRHLETNPADFYLFIAGDAAFSAVGKKVQDQYGKPVEFILPDPNRGRVLKALFTCRSFTDFQPKIEENPSEQVLTPSAPESDDPIDDIIQWVKQLRRELSTAIPVDLIRAMLGPARAQPLLDHARTEMKIDLWESPNKVKCISLREERMAGIVVKMDTRPGIKTAARLLLLVTKKSERENLPIGRPDWRRFFKDQAGFTNAEAKSWIELLFEFDILKDGSAGAIQLDLPDVISFVQAVEKRWREKN